MTSEVVLSDRGECTSNALEFVYASKVSQKGLYKQTDCSSVGKVLLLEKELKLLLWTHIFLATGATGMGCTNFHCLMEWRTLGLLQIQTDYIHGYALT